MIEKRIVANEWDMGWFCDSCNRLFHWKTKANCDTITGKKYCDKCIRNCGVRKDLLCDYCMRSYYDNYSRGEKHE